MQKEDILAEIRRTAQENGGKPLGVARFEQVTGIGPYNWNKFWPRFSEAQREAGFEPNKLISGFTDEYLLESIANLTRELRKFPVYRELRLKRHQDKNFPDAKVFERFGTKKELVARLYDYCKTQPEYDDIMEILEPIYEPVVAEPGTESTSSEITVAGFVYLIKGHPGEYKIGRTNLIDRRLSELGATASIEQELIHEIKTDDPAGIETYWHRRFADKRMRGEWFKLSPADVKAFKRWRRIY